MTSPVERISGPRIGSTPGNLRKGKTGSLIEKCLRFNRSFTPCCFKLTPAMHNAAIFAKGKPDAFETNGTVLEALGLTSKM